jgi:hypothetical protein
MTVGRNVKVIIQLFINVCIYRILYVPDAEAYYGYTCSDLVSDCILRKISISNSRVYAR